ncbi:methyl-accepting chemotaxis protein [Pseudomonas vancouverensis]|uniref:Methyl-accepting chemotaxis protein n=1 Tax=Pseudomonas vancouverensis TaxID=95300 RepID=A0A1H2NY63_PSEVA|nr:methyl-accepting chemotaxis protein [Pseudomonas vancouverensis]KAB0496562.1 HAMP domain-containing protein [Pseudomonas vancouverensis]TDB64730.1 methyl-accepting chemotaxis protein [Pseudomonas vancouverensis]SDV10397.1 methyl-accepting chemotaxis protein [Pseudomonas vancouverensis]
MSFLKGVSIGAKLLVLPSLFVLALLVVSGLAYQGLAKQQAVIEEIDQLRFQQYRQVLETAAASQAAMVGAYAIGARILESNGQASSEELESYLEDMQASVDEMQAGLDKVARETRLGDEEKELYRAVQDQASVVGEGLAEFKRTTLSDQIEAASLLGRVRADNNGLQGQFNRLLGLQAQLTSEAFASASTTQHQLSQMLVVVLLAASTLAVLVSLLLRAQIIRPIREIEQASIELRDGDLTRRVRVMGRDEIARTAQAFNELIESFQQAMRQVAGVAASVGASAEELVGTSARVAESSSAQSGAVGAVSMTIEQMSNGMAVISNHAESLRSCAEASLRGTEDGHLALSRLLEKIDSVRHAFTAIRGSVGDFVESTTAITASIGQVKDLSAQTSMLALNAAIEAARAGESGRGFSVVADEVRNLAQRSATAANSINELTLKLESQSETVDEALQAGTVALDDSGRLLSELENTLQQAAELVGDSTRGVDRIADAVSVQSEGGRGIVANVEHIARMAGEGDAITHQVSGAVVSLRELSHELNLAVGRFRFEV